MQFPKTLHLSFVATSLFLVTIPSSGVVAGRIPFYQDQRDVGALPETRFPIDKDQSFKQQQIRPPPPAKCKPGEHGSHCKPSLRKRSPLQISNNDGEIPHGLVDPNVGLKDLIANGKDPAADGKDPAADGKDPAADGKDPAANGKDPAANGKDPAADGKDFSGGANPENPYTTPTSDLPIIPSNSLAHNLTISQPSDIEPHTISITSTLSSVQDQPGYLGICILPFTAGDGILGNKNDKSPVTKFLSDAEKSAKCNWLTDSEAHCVEQGGKQDMQEDKIWWEQAFCKRCVDAGGLSREEFSCPKGYSADEILKRVEGEKMPQIILHRPFLRKSAVKMGAVGEVDTGKNKGGIEGDKSVGDTTPDDKNKGAGGGDTTPDDKNKGAGGGDTTPDDKSKGAGGGEDKTKGSDGGLVRRDAEMHGPVGGYSSENPLGG